MLVSTAGYQDGKQLCQPGFGQSPAEQGSSYVERYASNGAQLYIFVLVGLGLIPMVTNSVMSSLIYETCFTVLRLLFSSGTLS